MSVDNNNVSAKYNSPRWRGDRPAPRAEPTSCTDRCLRPTSTAAWGGARSRDASNALAPFSNRAQYARQRPADPFCCPGSTTAATAASSSSPTKSASRSPTRSPTTPSPPPPCAPATSAALVDASGRVTTIYDPWSHRRRDLRASALELRRQAPMPSTRRASPRSGNR